MADETKPDAPGAEPSEAPEAGGGGSTVNSQVTDAIAALNTLTEGLAPSTSAAMLGVMGADSIALAMLNAVARQQADATIASAALASVCARLAGTCLPEGGPAAANPAQFVVSAEAQAQHAIVLLKNQAELGGDAAEAAGAALARVAAAAAPGPPAKAGKAEKRRDDIMSEVDPTIVDAINQAQTATMSPQVVLTGGAGKAYQAVAASAALAIQDAVDALRHTTTIATTASGIALAQFLASGDDRYLEALSATQTMVTSAIEDFARVGAAAAVVVKEFPSG